MKKIFAKSRSGNLVEILVDDEDYDYLNQYKWRIAKSKNTCYATRNITLIDQKNLGLPMSIRMHRDIMGVALQNEKIIDHINHNGLDNQRSNLRICSLAENQANRQKIKQGHSIYKGVTKNRNSGWMVKIQANGIPKYVGVFTDEEEAALAYNEAAIKLFGEFANLNVIKQKNIQHEN